MSNDQVGIYYENQPLEETPAFIWSRDIARQHKKDGSAYFVDHGKKMRLVQKRELKAEATIHGSFQSAWQIKPSDGIPVWQMRKQRA